jgi:hypothetical protein
VKRSILSHCDEIFSKQIRERDHWTCQRCFRRFPRGASNLHCSHYWGRSDKATRFDPLNCDALCSECHPIWEADKNGAYRAFKLRQLGTKAFADLERRARSTIKFGAYEQAQKLKELMHGTAMDTRWNL